MDPNLFTGTGVPALAALEMAAQVTAGVGNPDRLLAAGMSAQDAQAVAAMITASQSNPVLLASASGIGGI